MKFTHTSIRVALSVRRFRWRHQSTCAVVVVVVIGALVIPTIISYKSHDIDAYHWLRYSYRRRKEHDEKERWKHTFKNIINIADRFKLNRYCYRLWQMWPRQFEYITTKHHDWPFLQWNFDHSSKCEILSNFAHFSKISNHSNKFFPFYFYFNLFLSVIQRRIIKVPPYTCDCLCYD